MEPKIGTFPAQPLLQRHFASPLWGQSSGEPGGFDESRTVSVNHSRSDADPVPLTTAFVQGGSRTRRSAPAWYLCLVALRRPRDPIQFLRTRWNWFGFLIWSSAGLLPLDFLRGVPKLKETCCVLSGSRGPGFGSGKSEGHGISFFDMTRGFRSPQKHFLSAFLRDKGVGPGSQALGILVSHSGEPP